MERSNFRILMTGVILVALCCFAVLLLVSLGILGVGAFTPYFRYALIAAGLLLIVIGWISYRRYKRSAKL